MSTPPPYPFRSRREIHSGEPKVYSDAELHEQHVSQDEAVTPAQGTSLREASGRDSSRVWCCAASAQCGAGR